MFRILYILIVLSTSLLWRSASQADVALVDMFAKIPSVDTLSDSETDKFVALRSTKIEDKESPRNGLTIAWIVIPSHDYFFTVKDVRKDGDANGIFTEIECAGSPVFANGGFYRYDDSSNRRIPMGLVVASGTKFSPVWKWKTGGALFDGPKQKLVPVAHLKSIGLQQNALQSKPMLVWNTKNGIRQDGGPAANRVAVGVTHDNNWIVIGAFGNDGLGVTLKEFADIIVSLRRLGGVSVDSALNMDGGPSAHMYVPKMGKHFGDPGHTFLPNVVCFKSRRN
jgi:Phosphodiester glycosidase